MSFKYTLWNRFLISRELTKGKMIPYDIIQRQITKSPAWLIKKMRYTTLVKLHHKLKTPEPLKYPLNEFNPDDIYKATHKFKTEIPFYVERTHTNCLPVYSEYKQRHLEKFTVIRRISGDIGEFVNELKKITSNSNISVKKGRLEIQGLHTEKIKLYLSRLGF